MSNRKQIEDLENRVTALEEIIDFLLEGEDEVPDDEVSEDDDFLDDED